MSQESWLRGLTDTELRVLAEELAARAEEFEAKTRQVVNDELRRRRMPTLGFGRSRH